MITQTIQALLTSPVAPAIERDIVALLPMTLRRVERADDRGRDYHIDAVGKTDLGFGWSQVSARTGIPYVAFLIAHPMGKHISGVAFQSPELEGRWIAQLHRIAEVRLNA